ncbi:MAG: Gfo/Idh/MocA family oxidoreductase [Ramlibacter sp.]|nr:Gfo/Idh/MocA family oxidoreductase [Ramlibacter sp.]
MTAAAPLRVLVVGCGSIAGGFDETRAAGSWPLTHAGAYARHGGFRLAACVEPDAVRRQAFMARWSVDQGYPDLCVIDSGAAFDVVSICSPTGLHAAHLAHVLRLRPQLVFCEKPVTPSASATLEWIEAFEAAGIAFAVNHTRRWAPDLVRLKGELAAGRFGAVRSVVGHYNKGILNNGSHMIDLCRDLFGPLRPLWAGSAVADFWPDDPTIAAMLATQAGVPVVLVPAHAADYALFELEIVTERGMLVMEQAGLAWRWREAAPSRQFAGYRSLADDIRTAGEYEQAMTAAAANIHDALAHGTVLASTGRTACEAQQLCETIRQMSKGPRS